MGYFDEDKNRSAWMQELKELKTERERRASGESGQEMKDFMNVDKSMREPITFEQLLAEEFGAEKARLEMEISPAMELSAEKAPMQ